VIKVGENILDKKRLELLSKSDDFDTGFNNSGLAIEDYLLVRIRNSDLFAKLYLYVCKNISQNKIKFSPVNIDYNKCVGCGACIMACPYDARVIANNMHQFETGEELRTSELNQNTLHQEGTCTKCNFCLSVFYLELKIVLAFRFYI